MISRLALPIAGWAMVAPMLSTDGASAAPGALPAASFASVELAEYRAPARRRHHVPGGPAYYRVNRYGFGRYVHGPNGSFGGYPAGSGGARELQINREMQCRYTPEQC